MNGMVTRRQIVGAEIVSDGHVHFRVWAPKHKEVQVVLEAGPDAPRGFALESEAEGYFAGAVTGAGGGTRYRFRLGGSSVQVLPDPASRYQPEGPCGPSEVIDPLCFRWTDQAWQGIASVEGQVLYELHVGTFTPQGTWTAALQQLPYLAELGITVLEIMPMAEFPGSFGWGYDGVDLFAPFHGYGIPEDVRRFVDRAHALGLGVILDVVYNHLGPEGNVLGHYSDDYFSRKYQSEWGDTFNFDGPGSGPVREFVLANVAYWVEEFHFDGMRVDATQGLYDSSPVHILAQIARRMREAAGDRRILIVGESEPQRAGLLRGADRGGIGFDMLWSDDFHHTATVAATGNREAYYGDYLGSPQELVSVLKRGWLYQGQWDLRQGKRRGSPALDIADGIHWLPSEPRSDCQHGPRRATAREDDARPVPRPERPPSARPDDAAVVSRTGVCCVEPVSLLQRRPTGGYRAASPGPPEIPQAVPKPGDGPDAGSSAEPEPSRSVRSLEAQPCRA